MAWLTREWIGNKNNAFSCYAVCYYGKLLHTHQGFLSLDHHDHACHHRIIVDILFELNILVQCPCTSNISKYISKKERENASPDVCIGKLANERLSRKENKEGNPMGSHPQESSWDDVDDAMSQLLLTSPVAPIPMMSFHKKVLAGCFARRLWRIPTLNGSEPNLCLLPLQSLEKCR